MKTASPEKETGLLGCWWVRLLLIIWVLGIIAYYYQQQWGQLLELLQKHT